MKANIEVSSREEATAIKHGLEDPAMRAIVVVTGALSGLSERARTRVLNFVLDNYRERETQPQEPQSETAPKTDGQHASG